MLKKAYIQNQKAKTLISETHFTKSYIKIHKYTTYDTHPDGTAHGGTAIIIRNVITHHLHGHYNLEHLQATTITTEDWIGPLTTAAVYCLNTPLKPSSSGASMLLLDNASWQKIKTQNTPTGVLD